MNEIGILLFVLVLYYTLLYKNLIIYDSNVWWNKLCEIVSETCIVVVCICWDRNIINAQTLFLTWFFSFRNKEKSQDSTHRRKFFGPIYAKEFKVCAKKISLIFVCKMDPIVSLLRFEKWSSASFLLVN